MKIRTDFVTNSSSSSFIVAHDGYLTEKQRYQLIHFALKNFLGNVTCSTEEELVNYFNKEYRLELKVGEFTDENGNLKEINDNDNVDSELYDYISCLKEIKKGNSVSIGYLNFEDDIPIDTLISLQQEFWGAMLSSNFKTIKDDLNF